MLILIVAGGPDKGRLFQLADEHELILGREGDQVRLDDRKVSRRHARLWREGETWFLEDLDSSHGTYLNHERITGKVQVTDGDYLQIGKTVLVMAHMADFDRQETVAGIPAPVSVVPTAVPPATASASATPAWRSALPLATAAALLIAMNGGLFYYQSLQSGEIQDQLAQSRDQAARLEARLGELSPDSDSFRATLGDALSDVETRHNRDQVLGDILARVSEPALGEELDKKLDVILATVNGQADPTAQLEAIALAVREQPQRLDEALARLGESTREAEAMQARLDPLIEQLASTADATRETAQASQEQIAASTKAVQATQQRLASLQEAMDASTGQPDASLAAVAAVDRKLDAVLAKVNEPAAAYPELPAVPTVEEITQSVLAALPPSATPEQVAKAVAAALPESQPTPAASPDAVLAAVDPLIARLSQKMDQLPTTEQLQQQLAAVREAQQQLPGESGAMKQVLAAAEAQKRVDLKLSELEQLVRKQASPDAALLEAVLAAMENRNRSRSDQALSQVLDELRDLKTTVASASATSAPATASTGNARAADAGLSELERAYRDAYETGQKVTIGARVDPETGERLAGRTLDPVAARDAGHRTWREWYLIDDYSERQRLRQLARRTRDQRDAQPDLISLPTPSATASDRKPVEEITEITEIEPLGTSGFDGGTRRQR